jgi:hypothetical protein
LPDPENVQNSKNFPLYKKSFKMHFLGFFYFESIDTANV